MDLLLSSVDVVGSVVPVRLTQNQHRRSILFENEPIHVSQPGQTYHSEVP